MISPEAEAMNKVMLAHAERLMGSDLTLEEQRAASEEYSMLMTAEPAGVDWFSVDVWGVPAIWANPAGGAEDRAVLYLHGGGYIVGSAREYKNLGGHIARAVGCRVLILDYRLAPEHPHPSPVNESVRGFQWLLDNGLDPSRLALSGDSAGGGLALATLIKLRDDGLPQPAAAVTLSPWADMEILGTSMRVHPQGEIIISRLRAMAELFLAGVDPRDPLASPIHADFTGICPLYIQVGGDEVFLDDAVRVEEAARHDGVEVILEVFPQMQHVFQLAAGRAPEADDAVAKVGAFLRRRIGLV